MYSRKNGETPTIQEYVEYLINKGIITEADVEDLDENIKNITVEGYVFLVEKEESGDIKITYKNKADNKARIAKLEVTKTTINSISVKVIASNATGGSYKYSIKDITAGETNFTEVTTIEINEYTFTSLVAEHEYIIEVELTVGNDIDTKKTKAIKAEAPKVTEIILDKTEIEILKGKNEDIIAEILPEEAVDKTLTWESSNESVVTVDSTGKVTGASEGKAIVTATSANGISASCNVTVTLPPPPTVDAGAETHIAKEISYTWEELNSIAKVISDNYGTEEGKINNGTAEVSVVVNGEEGTLGIGDYKTVNGKQVRILGFNHDELTNTSAYREGENNTYAGISFEFVEFITNAIMNETRTTKGGWEACPLRVTLNSTIYDSLENKQYIKQVNKQYIEKYNDANSVKKSQNNIWLLSCSEIWNNGRDSGGNQYKYYKNINPNASEYNKYLKKEGGERWWLRSIGYRF